MDLIIFCGYLTLAVVNFFSAIRAAHNQAPIGVMIAAAMILVFGLLAICKFVEMRASKTEDSSDV